jgi:hypothetical protein
MLLPPCWTLSSNSIENSSSFDDIMLSTATTSNQHQPNFWFSGNPLPSFFSSSTTASGGIDKNPYIQQPMTNKILFDTNPCSSSSEGSPPLSNDFLLTRSNPATTLNLTQFNYIQQNHHHHPSSNGFIPRDDWSQIPMAQTTISPNSPVWAKGKEILFFCFSYIRLIDAILLYKEKDDEEEEEEVAQYLIYIIIHLFLMVIR